MMTPIIVVGARRSGTTLLRTMLTQHPQLAVHPDEPQFFLELYQKFGEQSIDTTHLIDYVVRHPYCVTAVDPAGLHHHLPTPTTTLPQLAQAYLATWLTDPTQHPVLKHPRLVFYLNGVCRLFPNAKIINLVRDPRANVASQRARWPHLSVWECASWWHNALHASQQFQQQHPQTSLTIRYEDLVLKPTATLQQICHFLNLPYTAAMEDFHLQIRSFSASHKNEAKTISYTRPEPSRLNRWQTQLSNLDIRLIEKRCHPFMAQWQYTPSQPTTPPLPYVLRWLTETTAYSAKQIKRRLT